MLILVDMFLNLANQVQTLTSMLQVVALLLPQLTQQMVSPSLAMDDASTATNTSTHHNLQTNAMLAS